MAGNTFDRFSVFFTGDTVFLDGTVFPLGQLAADVLNLDGKVLTEIDRRVNYFISVAWTLFPADGWVQHLLLQQYRTGRDGAHLPQGRCSQKGESSHRFEPGKCRVPEGLQPFESENTEREDQRGGVERCYVPGSGGAGSGGAGKLSDEEMRGRFAAF